MDVKHISEIELNQTEYCYLVGKHYYDAGSLKIRIPKLMPNGLSNRTEPFNRNILVNAKDCKPSVASTLRMQNYITVRRSPQCSLYHKVIDLYGNIPSGLGLTCMCVNNNYKDMKVIDSL